MDQSEQSGEPQSTGHTQTITSRRVSSQGGKTLPWSVTSGQTGGENVGGASIGQNYGPVSVTSSHGNNRLAITSGVVILGCIALIFLPALTPFAKTGCQGNGKTTNALQDESQKGEGKIQEPTNLPRRDPEHVVPERNNILTLKETGSTITIQWQQWLFSRRQDYVLCYYTTEGGITVPVFIQSGYIIHQTLTVDSSLQYGIQEGVLFLVYHNKGHRPYQHQFMRNEMQKYAYPLNDLMKMFTRVDLSLIAGDYLRDVK